MTCATSSPVAQPLPDQTQLLYYLATHLDSCHTSASLPPHRLHCQTQTLDPNNRQACVEPCWLASILFPQVGLVLVDRNTVTVGPCDVNLSFGAHPAEITGRVR